MQLDGQHILIVGAARSGIAAAHFLHAGGARVAVNDAKPVAQWAHAAELHAKGIQTIGGAHPVELFEQAELIVVSPGVPLAHEAFKHARAEIIGEAELALRFMRGKVIGVTGSNGKTTTTTLIGALLKDAGLPTQVGGNIGTALISLVETSRDDGFTVAELSSFQLEAVRAIHLHVAVHLNVTPDHLDRYASLAAYAEAKANILINQTPSDWAVLNADNEWTAQLGARTAAHKLWFSRERDLTEGICLQGDEVVQRASGVETVLLKRHELGLRGEHNLENVMAALAAGRACGASVEAMRATVRAFKGVEHRLEFVAAVNGVQFYNDSKATNVDAALKSLAAFPGRVTVIFGGKDKGSDYAPLVPLVRERCEHVILLGAAADQIGAALRGVIPLHRAVTMDDAVRLGFALASRAGTPAAQSDGIVLLAPACASFDMFDNFEHRGRVFKDAVGQLIAECG